jgi:hypothetical protein
MQIHENPKGRNAKNYRIDRTFMFECFRDPLAADIPLAALHHRE